MDYRTPDFDGYIQNFTLQFRVVVGPHLCTVAIGYRTDSVQIEFPLDSNTGIGLKILLLWCGDDVVIWIRTPKKHAIILRSVGFRVFDPFLKMGVIIIDAFPRKLWNGQRL